jgi:hypothetical protein
MEKWKKITYNKFYEVSNYGRIKSLHFNREKILKPQIDKKGYCYVYLNINGNSKKRKIHQLVMETFVGMPPSPLHVTDHIDFNKTNNSLSNLRYLTISENSKRKNPIL